MVMSTEGLLLTGVFRAVEAKSQVLSISSRSA
jgi:hypothetical protein